MTRQTEDTMSEIHTNVEKLGVRKEYDKRILNYLCGKGIKPQIEWYKAEDFGEKEKILSKYSYLKEYFKTLTN